MQYKIITYYDNMEDDVEIYDNKDEAIKRLHHLRGVKYRNSKLYKVEMVEVAETDLITKINEWAISHGLDKGNPKIEWMKVTEEVGEIRDVFLKPNDFDDPELALKDAIGDSIVTLVVLCLQLGYDVEECLKIAYNNIKDRQGKMVNGTFVKEEDL
ncbi:DNA binding protein [Streptococcus phage SW18]|uniref:DNA binding protein n=1 Tax=Streptococcus phage SW18 TaxID=2419638 RepID=A0A3S7WA32_9CAUD|nr:DNA binding protein [Streptococcus phage SW18]AYP29666.1 DNA binding protein [Streptococcus phage SW18]